jgi:hypothetical protein
MMRKHNDWARWPTELTGPRFAEFQIGLTKYNVVRFEPGLPEDTSLDQLKSESQIAEAEVAFVEGLRQAIAPQTANIPSNADDVVHAAGSCR